MNRTQHFAAHMDAWAAEKTDWIITLLWNALKVAKNETPKDAKVIAAIDAALRVRVRVVNGVLPGVGIV